MGGSWHVEAAPHSWCVLCSWLGSASVGRCISELAAVLHLPVLGSTAAAPRSRPACVCCMSCSMWFGLAGIPPVGPSCLSATVAVLEQQLDAAARPALWLQEVLAPSRTCLLLPEGAVPPGLLLMIYTSDCRARLQSAGILHDSARVRRL